MMEIEVYADLLFLVNAGMDWLCFALTGWILHRKLSGRRMAVGAALGGVYAVASLLLDVGSAVAFALDAAVCLLMCAVVFARKGPKGSGFWSASATYFALSMALGGVMTALYNLLNRLHLPGVESSAATDGDGPAAWLFAILALAGGAITLWGGRAFRRNASQHPCRVTVTVTVDGRRVTLDGMVDTGNLLRDPMGGRPVICADLVKLTPVLSPALSRAMSGGGVEALTAPTDARRFRLIPAGTATGGGILSGFLPDRIEITYTSPRTAREEIRAVDAVIACTPLADTEALVPTDLLG